MNFIPVSPGERLRLHKALQDNAYHSTPITMNPANTTFSGAGAAPESGVIGWLKRMFSPTTDRIVPAFDAEVEQKEVDDMLDQISSVPTHY